MAETSITGRTCTRYQRPHVNLFDIPELMPGARSSATPAARMEFEQRCIQLYVDEAEEQRACAAPVTATHVTVQELEAIFPALDPALVRVLAADAGTPQQAMETLLMLAAAAAEPVRPHLPETELGLQDMDAFPSLMDADGWQVPSQHLFDRSTEEDLGSAWSDRAKAIASKPAPLPATSMKVVGGGVKKRASKQELSGSPDAPQSETEYEFRQRLGRQRIQNRTRFPGSRRGSALATAAECRLSEASQEDDESLSAEDTPAEAT